jgi:hypothetical protein
MKIKEIPQGETRLINGHLMTYVNNTWVKSKKAKRLTKRLKVKGNPSLIDMYKEWLNAVEWTISNERTGSIFITGTGDVDRRSVQDNTVDRGSDINDSYPMTPDSGFIPNEYMFSMRDLDRQLERAYATRRTRRR